MQLHTCHLSHALIQCVHGWCSRMTWHSVKSECFLPNCSSLRFKFRFAHVVRSQPTPLDVTLEELPHGGYAGVRLGEAQNTGPDAHERVAEEPCARRTCINEAGDAAPGSQDSITWGVRNLQLTNSPAATQPTRTAAASPPMHNSRRPTQPRTRQQREYLRCAQCGSDPEAYIGSTDSGLMTHMRHKHGGQHLLQESVAQLRQLGRAACVFCGTI